jgi:hypothetical protein
LHGRLSATGGTNATGLCYVIRESGSSRWLMFCLRRRSNQRIQQEAIRLAKQSGTTPVLLAVWNGNPGDGSGGTAHAMQAWQKQGHDLVVIDIAQLRETDAR